MALIGAMALTIFGFLICLVLYMREMREHQRVTVELLGNAVNQTVRAISEAMAAAPYGGGPKEIEQPEDTEQTQLLRTPWEQWGDEDPSVTGIDHTDALVPDEPQFDNANRVALVDPGFAFRPPPDLGGESYPDEPA